MITTSMWFLSLALIAQNITVTGTVNDQTGIPVIGATIVVEGSAGVGTTTDVDGNFTLSNISAESYLLFSYVGMKTERVALNGRTTINLVLC